MFIILTRYHYIVSSSYFLVAEPRHSQLLRSANVLPFSIAETLLLSHSYAPERRAVLHFQKVNVAI